MSAEADPGAENLTAMEKWAFVMGFTPADLANLVCQGITYPSMEAAMLHAHDVAEAGHAR